MENLGIDVKLLIAQGINFALFFIVFKKFLAKPFSAFLTSEQKKDKERERIMSNLQKQEEEYTVKEAAFKKRLKKEEDEFIKKAKEDAQRVKADLMTEAKHEADQLVAKAKKEMQSEKEEMYQEVKKKAGELSLIMVAKALEDSLDESSKKKITAHILTNLNKRAIQNEN